MSSVLQGLVQTSNNLLSSFRTHSRSHDVPQTAADPRLFFRAADMGLHKFGFNYRIIERIRPRLGPYLTCGGSAESSDIYT